MTKLDQFIQDKKELKFSIGNRELTADISAKTLITLVSLTNSEQTESEMLTSIIEKTFSENDAEYIWSTVNIKGINVIVQQILGEMGIDVEKKN